MYKRKLGICIQDKEYEKRFIRCVMNHYREQYEIHVLSSLFEIVQFQEHLYEAIITGDEEVENSVSLAKKGQNVLILQERAVLQEEGEHLAYAEKYQEVYKIVEVLKTLIDGEDERNNINEKKCKIVGISSLSCENLQLPFATLCASIYGEKNAVLLLDLQPFSGMECGEEYEEDLFGMEDVMSIASTGIVTKNRILGAIRHEAKWDYVRSVKNTECLVEANENIYRKMIEMMVQEQGYEIVIINFGATFTGMFELMTRCQEFYWLREKGRMAFEREQTFFHEIRRRGKESFLERMTPMELSVALGSGTDWKSVSKQWLWGTVGNQLREHIWVEKQGG